MGRALAASVFADCLSDGETVDQAIQHGREALIETIETLKAHNRPVPAPNSGGVASGRFVTRVPRSIHAMLTTRAPSAPCTTDQSKSSASRKGTPCASLPDSTGGEVSGQSMASSGSSQRMQRSCCAAQ